MGSYHKPRPEKDVELKATVVSEYDISFPLLRTLQFVYNKEPVEAGPKLGKYKFVATKPGIVFDVVVTPKDVNTEKLHMALINKYSVEIIYLIAENVITKNKKITYRHISEYVKVLHLKQQTDLIRWLNMIRNHQEGIYENKRKQRSKIIAAKSKSQNSLRQD